MKLIDARRALGMYADYGSGYRHVRDFMLGPFDVMLNTPDASMGLPADGH